MARRSIRNQAQTDEERIEALTRPPRRSRQWEAEQRRRGFASYRGIPKDLQAQLKKIAADLHLPVGEVARRFLELGVEAYERGDLELKPVVAARKYTLYPDEGKP